MQTGMFYQFAAGMVSRDWKNLAYCESGFQAELAAALGEKVALYFSINIFPSQVHLM